jgi:hypothetical protein
MGFLHRWFEGSLSLGDPVSERGAVFGQALLDLILDGVDLGEQAVEFLVHDAALRPVAAAGPWVGACWPTPGGGS